jgi:hypothetical protein
MVLGGEVIKIQNVFDVQNTSVSTAAGMLSGKNKQVLTLIEGQV